MSTAAVDIQIVNAGGREDMIPVTYNVAAGVTINEGEPVERALGGATVTALNTGGPVVGTDFLVGVAGSKSTSTATAAGTVSVRPLLPGAIYSAVPTVPASWDTQAEYDALVGDRVVFTVTGGVYTIDAVDGATNGCVVMPKTLANPGATGRIFFSFRNGLDALS